MSKPSESRIQILKVLEILRKYSDCDNKINAVQIAGLLKEYGIETERRSIYADIAALVHCGYDINKAVASKEGFYCDGRELEVPEVRLLIDAVSSAKFITEKKTNELTEKLLSFLSIYQAENIKKCSYINKSRKFTNEEIYYSIDRITEALNRGKKITFLYYHKIVKNGRLIDNDGRIFTVSPYGIFWADDKYYVTANYEKYNDLSNFRIDRMKKVYIDDSDIRPFGEIGITTDRFDTGDYLQKSINAYHGTEEDVVLEVPLDMIDIVTDELGEDLKIISTGDNKICISVRLNVSAGLINWLLPNCDKLRVLRPESLARSIRIKVDSIYDNTVI